VGFLDRIASLVRRSDSGSADAKGPLGLMPGDVISYYHERFCVAGVRILHENGRNVFHYRLRSSEGKLAALSARSQDTESWMFERIHDDLDVDWQAATQTGPEGDAFQLLDEGRAGLRHVGDTGHEASQRVVYRRFADEDAEQMIVLYDFGVGREVCVADPVFEGELHFESDATAAESRPWAVAIGLDDAAADVEDDASVVRGSTVAAALALDGRFISEIEPSESIADVDPFEYADEEWSDARDAVPEPQALPGTLDAPNDPRAEWLTPTLWVAGCDDAPAEEPEDDWLVRQAG
jgi:hypothetical protein